jgi:ubiquinol-cytochrome c reductase cytochrome b subunit
MITLHTHGSGNPIGVSSNEDKKAIHPYYIFKDTVTIFVFIVAISYVVFYEPNMMGHSDNYIIANPIVTPPSIVPEW